jgi:hypothetical protein
VRWPWQPRPDPLGDGVWRRARDGFRRAVDRYHQVIESVPDGAVRADLERIGTRLAAALHDVNRVCLRAQAEAPSEGLDVPGKGWTAVHRSLTQAATYVAQAAQAAAMTRVAVAAGDEEAAATSLAAARRAAQRAVELVGDARAGVGA